MDHRARDPIMSAEHIEHITKTPGTCGGRACIKGHRIRVADVWVWHQKRGYSPEEIVDLFPGINLAEVYAALAYALDHQSEIEADYRAAEQAGEWLKASVPSKIPAELRERR